MKYLKAITEKLCLSLYERVVIGTTTVVKLIVLVCRPSSPTIFRLLQSHRQKSVTTDLVLTRVLVQITVRVERPSPIIYETLTAKVFAFKTKDS